VKAPFSGLVRLRPPQGVVADLKLAGRRLGAAPAFTIFAVLSIAAGVGVTTAVYSVVDSNLWRTSGIRDPQNVVVLKTAEAVPRMVRRVLSVPDLHDIRDAQSTLGKIGASYAVSIALQTASRTEMASAEAGAASTSARWASTQAAGGRSKATTSAQTHRSLFSVMPSGCAASSPIRDRRQSRAALRSSVRNHRGRPPKDFGGRTQGLRQSSLWVPSSSLDLLALREPASVPERERPVVMLVGRLRPGA
jgi:hypothetical protein